MTPSLEEYAIRARPVVEWLTASSDIVAFSAAITGQGGKGHVNEQSPDYWDNLFRECGFVRHDVNPKCQT